MVHPGPCHHRPQLTDADTGWEPQNHLLGSHSPDTGQQDWEQGQSEPQPGSSCQRAPHQSQKPQTGQLRGRQSPSRSRTRARVRPSPEPTLPTRCSLDPQRIRLEPISSTVSGKTKSAHLTGDGAGSLDSEPIHLKQSCLSPSSPPLGGRVEQREAWLVAGHQNPSCLAWPCILGHMMSPH